MVEKTKKIKNVADAKKNLRSGNPAKKNAVVNEYKDAISKANTNQSIDDTNPAKPVKLKDGLNPLWLIPTMIGLYLIGIAWIVIFYLTYDIGGYPVPFFRYFNFVAGFGFILGGFLLSTKWK